jgi:hypothetical protein
MLPVVAKAMSSSTTYFQMPANQSSDENLLRIGTGHRGHEVWNSRAFEALDGLVRTQMPFDCVTMFYKLRGMLDDPPGKVF